ncbi:hypothetical protein ZWY2020_013273 [Hordeum vulgare]|nr:hypothetical protein ZWY2020_013273 [Hordeum vulgare]
MVLKILSFHPQSPAQSSLVPAHRRPERCGPPPPTSSASPSPPEFPCVSRFRKRRLIVFLSHHRFFSTAHVLLTQTDVFLCLVHMAELVDAGSWDKAIDYLSRFLPSDRPLGVHGRALLHFLRVHKAIEDVLAGAPESRSVTTALDQCFIRNPTKSHAITRLRPSSPPSSAPSDTGLSWT